MSTPAQNPQEAKNAASNGKDDKFADRIIAAVGAVVAAAALILSFYEGHQTRLHNRLSVKPFLSPFWGDNNEFWIANKGVGPAIVKDQLVFVAGNLMPRNRFRGFDAAITNLGLNPPSVGFHCFDAGAALAVNDKVPMFWINSGRSAGETNQFTNAAWKLKIVIIYESIYGDKDAVWTNTIELTK
jgi:hypothetical protein